MKKIITFLALLLLNNAFSQNLVLGEKGLFYEIEILISILFYFNIFFIFMITYLAQKGKKLLIFLTIILENVFILMIGFNFGLEKLSVILLLINPVILLGVIIYLIKHNKK